MAGLACDVLLSPHPFYFEMQQKLEARSARAPNPFVDPNGCRAYAAKAQERLDQRTVDEGATEAVLAR